MHDEIEAVSKQVEKLPPSKLKSELRRKVKAMQLISDCGQDMIVEI
jgi:hypothetical protein